MKKYAWLIVVAMVVLLSLLAACGESGACSSPTTTPPTTTTTTPPTTTTTTPPTTTTTTPPTTTTTTLPTTTPDVSAGAELFQQNCAVCHGAEREGGIGPTLIGHGLTDEGIKTTIRQGQEGEDISMPSWQDMLTGEEIDDIVSYLSEE